MVAKLPVCRRDHHGQRHGLGLQPLPARRPNQFTGAYIAVVESRGASSWLPASDPQGHLPDVPGVLREAARRARALGQARRRRAGRADGAGGPGCRPPSAARTPCRGSFRGQLDVPAHAGVASPSAIGSVDRATSRPSSSRRAAAWCASRPPSYDECHARRRRLGGGVRRWWSA